METPERLLSDEEIGRVIKRASELDARSDGVSSSGTVSPAGSLSIQTVREIAEEIGIAAELADQAAAEVLVRPSDGLARLAGGSVPRTDACGVSPAALPGPGPGPRRSAARDGAAAGHGQGRARRGGMERGRDVLGGRHDHAQGGGHRGAGHTGSFRLAQGMFAVPIVAGLALGGIVVDQLHPDLLGMLGLLGSGVAVGAGVARGLWSVTARSFRRRLRAVQSEIHQFMRTGESEESLPSGDGSSEDHRLEPGGSDG